jgi:hypothetical protein
MRPRKSASMIFDIVENPKGGARWRVTLRPVKEP